MQTPPLMQPVEQRQLLFHIIILPEKVSHSIYNSVALLTQLPKQKGASPFNQNVHVVLQNLL